MLERRLALQLCCNL